MASGSYCSIKIYVRNFSYANKTSNSLIPLFFRRFNISRLQIVKIFLRNLFDSLWCRFRLECSCWAGISSTVEDRTVLRHSKAMARYHYSYCILLFLILFLILNSFIYLLYESWYALDSIALDLYGVNVRPIAPFGSVSRKPYVDSALIHRCLPDELLFEVLHFKNSVTRFQFKQIDN